MIKIQMKIKMKIKISNNKIKINLMAKTETKVKNSVHYFNQTHHRIKKFGCLKILYCLEIFIFIIKNSKSLLERMERMWIVFSTKIVRTINKYLRR